MRRILFSLIALALLVGLAGCSTAEADSVKVGPDAIVLEACSFMAAWGDWMDGNEARMVRRAIDAEAEVQRLYGKPAPRSAITLDGLIIWAFAAFFAFAGGVWLAKQAVAFAPDWALQLMGFM